MEMFAVGQKSPAPLRQADPREPPVVFSRHAREQCEERGAAAVVVPETDRRVVVMAYTFFF
jgi:hypothetical protein